MSFDSSVVELSLHLDSQESFVREEQRLYSLVCMSFEFRNHQMETQLVFN